MDEIELLLDVDDVFLGVYWTFVYCALVVVA